MKAVVIGGSGLVGGFLLSYLMAEPSYEQVISISRHPLEVYKSRDRYHEIIFDFKNFKDLHECLKKFNFTADDAAFCCLGTTIKKAGTREAFYKVDHDYVLDFAKTVRSLGVLRFFTVSALGANPNSKIFYNRVKGEMERDLAQLNFESLGIFRPSLLLGNRKEERPGEKLAAELSPFYSPLLVGPLKKYHPIQAEWVARAMVRNSLEKIAGTNIIENSQML